MRLLVGVGGHLASLGLRGDTCAPPAATGGRDPRDRARRRPARLRRSADSPLAWLRRSDGIVGLGVVGGYERGPHTRAGHRPGCAARPRRRLAADRRGGRDRRPAAASPAPDSSRSARSPSTRVRGRPAASSSRRRSSAVMTAGRGSPASAPRTPTLQDPPAGADAVRPVLVGDARPRRAGSRRLPGRGPAGRRRDRARRGREGRARPRSHRHGARGRRPAAPRARPRRRLPRHLDVRRRRPDRREPRDARDRLGRRRHRARARRDVPARRRRRRRRRGIHRPRAQRQGPRRAPLRRAERARRARARTSARCAPTTSRSRSSCRTCGTSRPMSRASSPTTRRRSTSSRRCIRPRRWRERRRMPRSS